MRCFLAAWVLGLLLASQVAAISINSREEPDDDEDADATANAQVEAEQATEEAAGPKAPAEQGPALVPAATVPVSLVHAGPAPAPGWDAIQTTRGGMCLSMGKKHDMDFGDNKDDCVVFMEKQCKVERIGICDEWFALLNKARAAAGNTTSVAGNTTSDAKKAHTAAETAKKAAADANEVATGSIHLVGKAQKALTTAHDALHSARVDSASLSAAQKQALKKAEANLKEATKKAHYGQIKNAKYVEAEVEDKKLQKLEYKMDKIKKEKKSKVHDGELEAMRKEIKELREELKKKEGDNSDSDEILKDLQEQIEEMKKADKKDDKKDKKSHDEMKAEIERLRSQIQDMEDAKAEEPSQVVYRIPEAPKEEKKEKYDVKMKPLSNTDDEEEPQEHEVTPVQQKGIDIDTAMPYGDLEPFGREDTAQELTEASIKESDGMVDQLEKAEVAEEKRSVFRALTRLRGAAITSFDGVARSQTGNIDEYNKVNKWRNSHPLHHLADEESDVSKWAFPDNAD